MYNNHQIRIRLGLRKTSPRSWKTFLRLRYRCSEYIAFQTLLRYLSLGLSRIAYWPIQTLERNPNHEHIRNPRCYGGDIQNPEPFLRRLGQSMVVTAKAVPHCFPGGVLSVITSRDLAPASVRAGINNSWTVSCLRIGFVAFPA